MCNEYTGFVMQTASGTVGIVNHNDWEFASMFTIRRRKLALVAVPVGSLTFLTAGPDEWKISLRLFRALPPEIKAHTRMRNLHAYIMKIRQYAR